MNDRIIEVLRQNGAKISAFGTVIATNVALERAMMQFRREALQQAALVAHEVADECHEDGRNEDDEIAANRAIGGGIEARRIAKKIAGMI